MIPPPSECRKSKVKYPAPWSSKVGEASAFKGLPCGLDTFYSPNNTTYRNNCQYIVISGDKYRVEQYAVLVPGTNRLFDSHL